MSHNPNNFSKYPNKDISKMSGNVISFPSDSDQYLKKIKVILNETISGLENLDQFKKYLDSDVIKTSCEECSFSLNQINKMDLNEPRDFAQLISIRDNLIALRRLILIKISELVD